MDSLSIECFPLTYLNGWTPFNCRLFLNIFPVCFNLFVLFFIVTSCLVVAFKPCMELFISNIYIYENVYSLIQLPFLSL